MTLPKLCNSLATDSKVIAVEKYLITNDSFQISPNSGKLLESPQYR